MPPRRSSSRTHQPAQRRPRTDKACRWCRLAKQRCKPVEYGTNGRPCCRCVSQKLDCDIPRAESPSSGSGAQGSGPVRHRITPRSAGGATEELTPDSETNVQYMLQQSESVRFPMEEWPPFMMRSDEEQGSSSSATILFPGETRVQTQSFFPLAASMEGYQQSFPNVAQGSTNLESIYYLQDYYGQTTSSNTYMANYAVQGAGNGAPNLGYAMEDHEGAFADEEDASLSRSDES